MSRIASTVVACLILAAFGTASSMAQDHRSPDAQPLTVKQDYRSPDAQSAVVAQDLTSPDAKPIALRRYALAAPTNNSSASGFSWTYPAIGVVLILVAVGSIAYASRRRTLTAA